MRKLAIGFWFAQAAAAIVMLFASAIEVASILWSGPMLSLVGLLHAIATRPLLSWVRLFVALSGPLVCAFIAVCIAQLNWSPAEAKLPVATIMALYTFVFYPATSVSLLRRIDWQATDSLSAALTWQFSLKSMLVAMTAICVVVAAARLVSYSLRDDDIIFNGFALVVVTLCGLVVWRFVALYKIVNAHSAALAHETNSPGKGCEDEL